MKSKTGFCLLFIIPCVTLLSQTVTGSYFYDYNWQPAKTIALRYYECKYTKTNDVLTGVFNCYDLTTNFLVKTYYYKNNKLNGPHREYLQDSICIKKGQFYLGKPVGVWQDFDAEHNLVAEIEYDSTGKIIRDGYLQDDDDNFNAIMGVSTKKEEPAVYGTECMLLKIDEQKYQCSDSLLKIYYKTPPCPPHYAGKTSTSVIIEYTVTRKNEVNNVNVLKTCGDSYLDWLAIVHIENMIPWDAAKNYGTPIDSKHQAEVVFRF